MPRRFALILVVALLMSAGVLAEKPGTWTFTSSMTTARYSHTATLLFDGKVLAFSGPPPSGEPGGVPLSSAELYEPKTGIWKLTGSLNVPRYSYATTLLGNGKVLAAGGIDSTGNHTATAEVYDPATGLWTFTGSTLYARSDATATLMADGRVLLAGGYSNSGFVLPAELYDPDTETWNATGNLIIARVNHQAVRLLTGDVLVVGGVGESAYLAESEVQQPALGRPLEACRQVVFVIQPRYFLTGRFS